MNNNPLVTVAVIAYNASSFIVETLESVKNQTYKNIELIVSDDASSDNTVIIAKKWISQNKNRFTSVKFLTVDNNTGVAANCQRALDSSDGEFIKTIGSDDILFPECIEQFLRYFETNDSIQVSFGKEVRFSGQFKDCNFEQCSFPFKLLLFRESVTAQRQLRALTKIFIGSAPTMFSKTAVIKSVGGFDDTYASEDGPLFIKLTSNDIKLYYMDKPVVYRRVHDDSITHERKDNAILRSYYTPKNKKKWGELQYKYATPFWRISHLYSNWLCKKIVENGNDRRSIKCQFYNILRRFINPFKWNLLWMNIQESILNIVGCK